MRIFDTFFVRSEKKKSGKIVCLASSLLYTQKMTEEKSDIVLYYNKNKGGMDTFDKLCHSYSVRKRSKRWPMRYFQGILDKAIVNARILRYCKARQNNENVKTSAFHCLKKLSLHLMKPHLEKRCSTFKLRRDIKTGIAAILKKR